MAIHNVLINVSDVARSADFYTRLLGGKPVGEATTDGAVLDFVTATIEFRRVDGAVLSTWHEDDRSLGFRHVGFKVAQVDPLAAELRAAGVPFRLEPVDAVGEVRIAFFFDPDGTVLEIVEGQLQYHDIVDRDGVAAERATATPSRPRFDHVGVTIRDLAATADLYRSLGFRNIGTLFFRDDPSGVLMARAIAARGAVAAFNVITIEHAEGIVAGAESAGLPVILQLSENAIAYHGQARAIAAATVELAAHRPRTLRCIWTTSRTSRSCDWRRTLVTRP
jgi:catechol 2,3-dioxygenase-like lactoylglutathione lyase family enzyme